MTRSAALALLTLLVALPGAGVAQPAPRAPNPPFVTLIERRDERNLEAGDARRVRAEFDELLKQHPNSLRTVLQADPSLLTREDYLTPYPRIAEYLKAHPEIARDPRYFIGTLDPYPYYRDRTPTDRAMDTLEGVLAGLAVLTGLMAALFVFSALIRQVIIQRRWSRQSKVQTEVHTKILDRLQSNDELLAYIQTPAGQRFLQSGPSPLADVEPRAIAAPFGRIFWSVQIGIVLVALGVGFWFVQRSVMAEIAPAFSAMGVIAAALGIGAIVSGLVSYVMSARFGLLRTGD
jgi:hypothetical protein